MYLREAYLMKYIFVFLAFVSVFVFNYSYSDYHSAVESYEAEDFESAAPLFSEAFDNGNVVALSYLQDLHKRNIIEFETPKVFAEFPQRSGSLLVKSSRLFIQYKNNKNKVKPIQDLQKLAGEENPHALVLLGKIAELENKKRSNLKKLKKKLSSPVEYYMQAAKLCDRNAFIALKRLAPENKWAVSRANALEANPESVGEAKLVKAIAAFKAPKPVEYCQWIIQATLHGNRDFLDVIRQSILSNLIKGATNLVAINDITHKVTFSKNLNLFLHDILIFMIHEKRANFQAYLGMLLDSSTKYVCPYFNHSHPESRRWYTLAAQNGNVVSCWNAGFMMYQELQQKKVVENDKIDDYFDDIKLCIDFLWKSATDYKNDEALEILAPFVDSIYIKSDGQILLDDCMKVFKLGAERKLKDEIILASKYYYHLLEKSGYKDKVCPDLVDFIKKYSGRGYQFDNSLGVIYKDGLCGEEIDLDIALKYFRLSIDQNTENSDVFYNLSEVIVHYPQYTKEMLEEALDAARCAFDLGDQDAAHNIACCLFALAQINGEESFEEALTWWKKAADEYQDSRAMLSVAYFYIQDNQDNKEELANYYLDRAINARNGHAAVTKAMMLMAVDPRKNIEEIKKLIKLAVEMGVDDCKELFEEFLPIVADYYRKHRESDSDEEPDDAVEDYSYVNKYKKTDKKEKAADDSPIEAVKLPKRDQKTLDAIMGGGTRKKVRWDAFVKLASRFMSPGDSIQMPGGSKVKFNIKGEKLDVDKPKHSDRAYIQGGRLDAVREFLETITKK
jgi:TPR repeat protein